MIFKFKRGEVMIQGKGKVSENNVFLLDKDSYLDNETLRAFVEYNKNEFGKDYNENFDMYKGDYPILHQQSKPLNKPDNRIVINFAKYIVDIFNGFFHRHSTTNYN